VREKFAIVPIHGGKGGREREGGDFLFVREEGDAHQRKGKSVLSAQRKREKKIVSGRELASRRGGDSPVWREKTRNTSLPFQRSELTSGGKNSV